MLSSGSSIYFLPPLNPFQPTAAMPPVNLNLFSPPFDLDDMLKDVTIEETCDGRLCVPDDPVEDLEWFPALYDDSLVFNLLPNGGDKKSELCDALTDWKVPKKRRTRKVGRRTWSLDPPERLLYGHLLMDGVHFDMLKKCTHCITRETPLWRSGPHGPRTLCNACGIRYKSRRLLPEHQPASRPARGTTGYAATHKKVCKVRRGRKSKKSNGHIY